MAVPACWVHGVILGKSRGGALGDACALVEVVTAGEVVYHAFLALGRGALQARGCAIQTELAVGIEPHWALRQTRVIVTVVVGHQGAAQALAVLQVATQTGRRAPLALQGSSVGEVALGAGCRALLSQQIATNDAGGAVVVGRAC